MNTVPKKKLILRMPLLTALVFTASPIPVARAQDQSASVPVISRGDVQALAFGGFDLGQSFTRVSTPVAGQLVTLSPSSNGSIGGGGNLAFTTHWLAEGEGAYIGGSHIIYNSDSVLNQSPPTTQRNSIDAHSSAVLSSGGIRYQTRIPQSNHLLLYSAAGSGALRVRDHLKVAQIGGPPGGTYSEAAATTYAVFYAALGVDYYFSERVGIFVDGRVVRGPSVETFGRLSIGFFLKIR